MSAKKLGPPANWELAYPPHPITGARKPNDRQRLAHGCPADVLFYGGARGGGKTEFLGTEAAGHGMNYSGIQMLLVRATREEMKSNVIPVLKRILPREIAQWSRSDHAFLFFNGSTLILDFMQTEADIERYLGSEFGWIGVDQAEHLTEYTVMGLLSCVRSTRPWPRTLRLTGNPGLGVGVAWLRRWFVHPVDDELGDRASPSPMTIWRPLPKATDPTPPDLIPTRCFIPARLQDNSALEQGDPKYLARIYTAFTPEVARAQAEGDWDASDATIVGALWARSKTVSAELAARYPELSEGQLIQWHIIQNRSWRPPVGALIYGSVDYGFGVPWAFHLHAVLAGGKVRTFFEYYSARKTDSQQAVLIREALESVRFADSTKLVAEALQWIVFDPSMAGSRLENGLAKSIIEVYRTEMPRVRFLPGASGRSARMSRPNRWLDALATAADGFPRWSVTTACPDLIRTVPEVTRDPRDSNVEDDASENHCYEDVGRFFEARPFGPRVAPPDPYAHLDPVSAAHHRAVDDQERKPARGRLSGFTVR